MEVVREFPPERVKEIILSVADRIEAEPWRYNQSTWGGSPLWGQLVEAGLLDLAANGYSENREKAETCGTAHCAAGWGVYEAFPEVLDFSRTPNQTEYFADFDVERLVALGQAVDIDEMRELTRFDDEGYNFDSDVAAMYVLGRRAFGLSLDDALMLFEGCWTPHNHDSVPAAFRALADGVPVGDL